jgi:hypothetical protein
MCVVGGSYIDTPGDLMGLLLTRSGGSWTAVTAPQPSDADVSQGAIVTNVSCPSDSRCVAVGQYNGAGHYPEEPLLLAWDGESWTAVRAPQLSAGAQMPAFTGVSCGSASMCVATGSYALISGMLLTGPA